MYYQNMYYWIFALSYENFGMYYLCIIIYVLYMCYICYIYVLYMYYLCVLIEIESVLFTASAYVLCKSLDVLCELLNQL